MNSHQSIVQFSLRTPRTHMLASQLKVTGINMMSTCMYVCIYLFTVVCIICLSVFVCLYMHMFINPCVCMHIYVPTFLSDINTRLKDFSFFCLYGFAVMCQVCNPCSRLSSYIMLPLPCSLNDLQ